MADMQPLTEDAKVILLLCGHFGDTDAEGSVRPLSLGEYNRLADWMVERELRPEDLLKDMDRSLDLGPSLNIDSQRIRKLLLRGPAMALAFEKWTQTGIWIACRSDAHYPARLKKHLKKQAPPVIFGVGDMSLLSLGGLAIVGSRNVDLRGDAFARKAAQACAQYGMPVVSGGAAGVDQTAMLSALDAGGRAIGIVADSLQKAAVAGKYRTGIREKRLALISPFHPESRFTVGNAMARNKYIYALSDFALIVSAETEKGGTWAGATEELKRADGKPLFVRMEEGVPEGNRALLLMGAKEFPQPPWEGELKYLLQNTESSGKQVRMPIQKSLFSPVFQPTKLPQPAVKEESQPFIGGSVSAEESLLEEKGPAVLPSFYDAILPLLLEAMPDWESLEELAEKLDVRKLQLEDWLKRALSEGVIKRRNRPVRYRRN